MWQGDDDSGMGSNSGSDAIIKALGPLKRAEILAGIYMTRADRSLVVKQQALQVRGIDTECYLHDESRPKPCSEAAGATGERNRH